MTATEATKPKLSPGKLFINGKQEDAASGKTIDVMNPATGELLTTVPDGDASDIDRAVAAARASVENKRWRGMDPSKKEKILWDVAELLVKHKDELAMLESMENGKTVREAAGPTSAPAASRTVLPFSIDSSMASSSLCLTSNSATFQSIFSFFDGSMPRQLFFSKLARAAATARSMSRASPSGTVVSSSPVAGFMTSMVLPLAASSCRPLINNLPGFSLGLVASDALIVCIRRIQHAGRHG